MNLSLPSALASRPLSWFAYVKETSMFAFRARRCVCRAGRPRARVCRERKAEEKLLSAVLTPSRRAWSTTRVFVSGSRLVVCFCRRSLACFENRRRPPTVGRALRATMAFKRCGCAPSQRVVNSRKECKVCKNRRERERKQRAHQVEQYVNLPAFNPAGHGHHTRTPDGSSTDTWGRTRAFPAMDCYTPTRGDVHRTFMERHMFKPLGLDGESGPKARRRLSAADDSFSRSNRMFSKQPGELTFVQSCYGKYSLNQVKITREQEDRYLAMQDATRLPLTLRAKFRRFGGEEHYVRVLTPLYANIRNVKAYELVENNTCALLTLFQLVIGRLVQVCDGLTVLSDPFAGSGWLLKGYAQFLERLRNPDDAMHLRGRRFVHNVDGFPRVGEVEFHDILDGDDSVVRLTFGNTPNSFWSDVSVADLGTCTGIEDGCCDDDGRV